MSLYNRFIRVVRVTRIDFVFSVHTGCTVEDLTGGSPRKMLRLDLPTTPIPQLDGNNDSEKESDDQEEDQVKH